MTADPDSTPPEEDAVPRQDDDDLPEQMRVRRDKREAMLAAGIEPYTVGWPRTHTLAEVRSAYPDLAPGTETGDEVSVVGRVMFLRDTGRLQFATLRAGDGTELQVMLSQDRVGPDSLARWKDLVDLGDHVGVTGEVDRLAPRRAVRAGRRVGDHGQGAAPAAGRAQAAVARRRGYGSGTSTSSSASRRGPTPGSVPTPSGRCASRSTAGASSRSRRRCCRRCTAARRPGRSSRTRTRSTSTCTCASRRSCSSSAASSAGSRRSSRSTATSATRAPTPRTAPSSRCSSSTRRTATTTRWPC